MAGTADRVRDVVAPVLAAHELDLYDVEVQGTLVRVVVDRAGGVDLDALGTVTRAVSRALDDADPIEHRYTLEVTSPGVERPLRTPEQFARAVGETVKVKTVPDVDGARRVEGVLLAADESGITLRASEQGDGPGDGEAERTLAYDQIAKAHTVFEWGSPHPPASPGKSKKKKDRKS